MVLYILRRLAMMIPTLIGITFVSFIIINLAPGSPIEQKLLEIQMGSAYGGSHDTVAVSKEVIESLNKQYGFDKPIATRYLIWLGNLARFDFGDSFKYEEPVRDLILSRFPVSLTFGFVSIILIYLLGIPLGIFKAIRHGSKFDRVTSLVLIGAYSVPPLIMGVLLLVFFASGTHFDWFPLGGMTSDNYSSLSTIGKILDRAHHMVLPVICYVFAWLSLVTMLMKSSMLDVIRLDYVRTAKAKGLANPSVYYKHALRNALIPVVTGMNTVLSVFFAGSIIIEMIFNIDGMGLLGFTAVSTRDYNVLMGLIFFQSLLLLFGRFLADVLYVVIDRRIDFA